MIQLVKKYRNLFDKRYKYKIYTDAKVIWKPHMEKWLNEKDREWMKELDFHLKMKFNKGKDYKIQGSVIYCKNLEVVYYARILCGDRVTKIEKCIDK